MTRRRWVMAVVLVVAVLAVAAGVPALQGLGSLQTGDAMPTFEVRRGEFVRRIHAEGNLQSSQATLLSAPARARGPLKIAWLAEDGSRVEEGEVVIRFDPTDMEKKLRDGKSDRATTDSRIAQKKVREESAARNLERDSNLAVHELGYSREFQSKDEQLFSRVEIIESEIDGVLAEQRRDFADTVRGIRTELADVELDLLGIERRKAEIQIEQAETEMEELEIRAPHAGIFVLKEVWGNVPTVGAMIWARNPLAELPQLDQMEAKVFVLEADAGGLEAGIQATLRLDAHPGTTYEATVKTVDTLAMRRNRRVPVQYFGVVLELAATDAEVMKPGQRVQAVLDVEALEEVLTVPRQAVFEKQEKSVVYVRDSGDFKAVEVELGASSLGRVVVAEGLSDGDVVALRDPTRPLQEPDEEDESGDSSPVASR